MGRKSFGCSAESTLGSKVMKAVLRTSRLMNFLLQIAEIAAMISSFIIDQPDL
jgi:hypothetical protein